MNETPGMANTSTHDTRRLLKKELRDGHYEELKTWDNFKNLINEKLTIYYLTLLHEIIKSKKSIGHSCCCLSGSTENVELCTAENIKFLIEEGARLDIQEINGDTPLHTAVAIGVDSTILDVLINTKHNDCELEPCRCGQKALQIQNNSNKTPIEISYISVSCLQKLNLEGNYNTLFFAIKKEISFTFRISKSYLSRI